MRHFWVLAGALLFAASAGAAEEPANSAMKALFDEMKAFAQGEKAFREGKKAEVLAIEAQIDEARAEAKDKGGREPAEIKKLQTRRLAVLEEVALRDVESAEKSVSFARRKLDIARKNLEAFERKKAEAEQTIALS